MKLHIYGELSDQLVSQITLETSFERDIDSIQEFEKLLKNKRVKYLLIADPSITSIQIDQIREYHPKANIMVLLNRGQSDNFEKTCISYGCVISDVNDPTETINKMKSLWESQKIKSQFDNVIALSGTNFQVGVTQTALAIGHTIANVFGDEVCVLGLNPYSPTDLPNIEIDFSFGEFYEQVSSGLFSEENDSFKQITRINTMAYIPSNRDFYNSPTIDKKPIQKMITILKDHYDYVLLDCGSFFDNHAPITGLDLAEQHLLIATQDYSGLEQYKRWSDQIFNRIKLDLKDKTDLIVNKYVNRAIISIEQIENELDLSLLRSIPYFPEANDQIMETDILINGLEKGYNKAILGLTQAVIGDSQKQEKKTRFSLLKKII